MSILDMTVTDYGAIGFKGSVKGIDVSWVKLIQIDLADRPRFYIEYNLDFSKNPYDFGIKIEKAGIKNPMDAGIENVSCIVFTKDEKRRVKNLISVLFESPAGEISRNGYSDFTMKGANYTGPISYNPNWIITEEETKTRS